MDSFEVVLGTYEEFILGYKIQFKDHKVKFVQSFANHSHQGSIRSVSSSKQYVASGGLDENVHLYDLLNRKEIGMLSQHNGTVTCLQFTHDGSFLLSGSDVGTIKICSSGSWQIEKVWNTAHKKSVISISIHPSGKLALSLGLDKILKTWNLVKGRLAYVTNLSKYYKPLQLASCVLWSPDGKYYIIPIEKKIFVFSTETAGVTTVIECKAKVSSVCFYESNKMCVGYESGEIELRNVLQNDGEEFVVKAHSLRVKCITTFESDFTCLVSASSSGEIKVWKIKNDQLEFLGSTDCECRITCLTVVKINNKAVNQEAEIIKETLLSDKEKEILGLSKKRKIKVKISENSDDGQRPAKKPTNHVVVYESDDGSEVFGTSSWSSNRIEFSSSKNEVSKQSVKKIHKKNTKVSAKNIEKYPNKIHKIPKLKHKFGSDLKNSKKYAKTKITERNKSS